TQRSSGTVNYSSRNGVIDPVLTKWTASNAVGHLALLAYAKAEGRITLVLIAIENKMPAKCADITYAQQRIRSNRTLDGKVHMLFIRSRRIDQRIPIS